MAQTLKFGNGTWATKKGSTLAYNDENDRFKPLPFTTTRASGATRVNKQGLIEVVENDRPRIDYTDSADGVLLLEKASTNLVTYSEQFDNAYWTKTGASVTSGFISPDGTNNALKLIEDSSNGNHRIDAQGISITSGTSQTFSMFLKYDSSVEWVSIREFGINAFVYCNIKNNVFGATNKVNNTQKIEDFGNGWKRISFTYTSTTQGANFRIYLADGDNIDGYQGDGTSGIYIYGAMLEQNSSASSYIPTQGSTVTRVADTASGAGNSEVFNDSEGVLFANIAANANDLTIKVISINDNSGNNVIRMGYAVSSNEVNFIVRATTNIYSYNQALSDITTINKLSISYSSSGAKVFINGFLSDSGALSSLPTGLSQLDFRYGNGSFPFYGKTKELAYYNTVLTDLELETLTSYRSLNELVTELNLKAL